MLLRRGTAPTRDGMTDESLPTADYYRKVAGEIRAQAEEAQLPEVRRELLDLAERFERMAQFVEKRYPNGRKIPSPEGHTE